MKWFKHYSNAHTNNLIEMMLSHKRGHEYFTQYWLLLEFLCSEFNKDTTVFKVSSDRLMSALRIKYKRKLSSFLEVLVKFTQNFDEDLFKFTLNSDKTFGEFYVIETPIMLELMGKEFKRTRQARGTATPKKKEERRKNKKENITTTDDAPPEKKSKSKPKKKPRGHIPSLGGNAVVESLLSTVTVSAQEAWIDCYENTEFVKTQILQAHAWIESNPKRRPKDFGRFMNNFLARGYENFRRKNILSGGKVVEIEAPEDREKRFNERQERINQVREEANRRKFGS